MKIARGCIWSTDVGTIWAQIHGQRQNTSIEKRLEHDFYYIRNWPLRLDIKIIEKLFARDSSTKASGNPAGAVRRPADGDALSAP